MKNKSIQKYLSLLSYKKSNVYLLFLSILFSLIAVSASLSIPVLAGKVIDAMTVESLHKDFSDLLELLFIILVCGICNSLFTYLQMKTNNKISLSLSLELKNRLIQKINVLPISYLDKTPTGKIQSIMTSDIDQASEGINMALTQFISGIFTILVTLIIMFVINYILAIVVILLTPLSLIVATIVSKNIYKYFKKQSIARGNLSGYLEEIFTKEKTIKCYNYEEKSKERFDELNEDLSSISIKAVFFSSCVNPTTRLVNNIIYASIVLISALLMIQFSNNDFLTIGALSTMLAYSTQYSKPFNEISSVLSELSNSLACISRVFEILNEKNDSDCLVENQTNKIFEINKIEFNNVSFSYEKNQKLIVDFNLVVQKGNHIAIVGKTGSGKTTLINLLMRFYELNSGDISINQKSIDDYSKKEIRNHFGMVLQETWLKNGTIKENIAFGNKTLTDEEIINAAKITKADQFIQKLPKGYDTIINNDDENISIGEKQLICITRVLINNPEILILDEATSNIDLLSEKQIQKDIDLLMKGKTAFVVAHRLSTIQNSDCIVVMKNGNIEEIGTHEKLLQKNGYYKELFMSQFV